MEKKEYKIHVYGCDDTTSVTMELSDDEYALISKLCDIVTETSYYGCMPTMEVEVVE